MSNNVTDGVIVKGVSLNEEARIRRELPARVKKFALEHMNVPLPWAWLWSTYQKHGEEGTLKILIKANATIHMEHYGAGFYRALSPYRTL